MTTRENELRAALIEMCSQTKKETDYFPYQLLELIQASESVIETVRTLIHDSKVHYGYEKLHSKNRLDLTLEAMIIGESWQDLFDDSDRASARKKLTGFGYHIKSNEQNHLQQ